MAERYLADGLGHIGKLHAQGRYVEKWITEVSQDRGCEVAPSCLTCPLPQCIYDLPPARATKLMKSPRLNTGG